MIRPRHVARLALLASLCASPAWAAPTLIASRPTLDGDGTLRFFVGGVDDGGRSLKPSAVELFADGASLGRPASLQALSDWAAVASEGSATWRPPLAVGLVYPWSEGVPSSMLDGIHAFFQRIPSRTTVYPTIYGRMRQGRARLTAGEIGRLDEIPYLDGHKPNVLDAIELDLGDLAADPAPVKILLVVTDGRDYADPKGEGPGDFLRLGASIRKAGVTPLVVAFPPPEAEAEAAAASLRDLHEAGGGFLRTLDQAEELDNTLESLGQGVADLLRVEFVPPWSWSTFGGARRLSARLQASSGLQLNAELGVVPFSGGYLIWVVVIVVVLAAAAVAVVLVARRRRTAADDEEAAADDDEALVAVHDLIRRGVSPARAAEELKRNYPNAVTVLAAADAEVLDDPRFPYFRTRPGKKRLQELRDLLSKKAGPKDAVGNTLAGTLAEVVEGRTAADQGAAALAARLAVDEWTTFASMDLAELSSALREAARRFPVLGTPRARGVAVSVQDALRARGTTDAVLVGWLVRSGGAGRRGETLKLSDGASLVGSSPACTIRIAEDPGIAGQHLEIARQGDAFVVSPRQGGVRVEGAPIDGPRSLTDGETIEIGTSFFVFKSASAGSLLGG
jgi:hypothetical protein